MGNRIVVISNAAEWTIAQVRLRSSQGAVGGINTVVCGKWKQPQLRSGQYAHGYACTHLMQAGKVQGGADACLSSTEYQVRGLPEGRAGPRPGWHRLVHRHSTRPSRTRYELPAPVRARKHVASCSFPGRGSMAVWPLAGSSYKHMHTYRRTLPQLKIIAAACMGQKSQPKRHATKWLATLGQGY